MTTEQEKKVLGLIVDAHNEFISMPSYHPSEQQEWIHHIHALQHIIMARGAVRDEPSLFTTIPPMTPQQEREYDAETLRNQPHIKMGWFGLNTENKIHEP